MYYIAIHSIMYTISYLHNLIDCRLFSIFQSSSPPSINLTLDGVEDKELTLSIDFLGEYKRWAVGELPNEDEAELVGAEPTVSPPEPWLQVEQEESRKLELDEGLISTGFVLHTSEGALLFLDIAMKCDIVRFVVNKRYSIISQNYISSIRFRNSRHYGGMACTFQGTRFALEVWGYK